MRRASASSARPSAPLWVEIDTRPDDGTSGANVAFIRTDGSMLRMPMQLGPIIRAPARRTLSSSAASASRPAAPVSANPAVMITSARI